MRVARSSDPSFRAQMKGKMPGGDVFSPRLARSRLLRFGLRLHGLAYAMPTRPHRAPTATPAAIFDSRCSPDNPVQPQVVFFLSLKDGEKIYRWWSNSHEVTVGPESKFVTLHNVRLEPELVLVGCTGPQTNYQCDGRGD